MTRKTRIVLAILAALALAHSAESRVVTFGTWTVDIVEAEALDYQRDENGHIVYDLFGFPIMVAVPVYRMTANDEGCPAVTIQMPRRSYTFQPVGPHLVVEMSNGAGGHIHYQFGSCNFSSPDAIFADSFEFGSTIAWSREVTE